MQSRLGLQEKLTLQKTGYVQTAVKWESDSDSDATDEEDLTM